MSTDAELEARPTWAARAWRLLKATLDKSAEDDAKDLGAAIAYYAFFSVFPLLVGMISLSGFLLDSPTAQESIFEVVEEAFPGSGAFVEENLEVVVSSRGALGLLGVLGLLWAGSAGFGAVTRAVNRAWGTRSERPLVLRWIRYFSMTVVTVVLMVLSIGVTAVVEIGPRLQESAAGRIVGDEGLLGRLPGWSTSILLVFVMFALVYKVMPDGKIRWSQAIPGALVAAALFEIGKLGVVVYLERIADFSVYGSLGSIIVLLLWLYVSARVLVFGAQFNVVLDRSRST